MLMGKEMGKMLFPLSEHRMPVFIHFRSISLHEQTEQTNKRKFYITKVH